MDSDQFVPIWTIACMEDIKALTTDMDLILDVLRGTSAAVVPVFVRNALRYTDTLGCLLIHVLYHSSPEQGLVVLIRTLRKLAKNS